MKILIYGDHWKFTSGFAREIKDIIPYLRKGNEVRQVSLGYNGYPRDNDLYVYHTKIDDVKDYYAQEVLHFALDDFKPDIVLTVQDFFMLPKISFVLAHPGKFKWVHWGTLDSDPLDFYSRESLNWLHYAFFQSHFAAIECKIVNPKLMGEVIYPSVDPKVFYKIKDKQALRQKFMLDTFNVIICNARGQQRKNVPVLIDAFKDVLAKHPNSVLILPSGITNTKTDKNDLDGYDLERFVIEAGLKDYVLLPRTTSRGPIDDDSLNIQYNLADINVLPSWGEGFGLPIVESGICHIPTVGINHSAVREVVLNKGLLVNPATYIYNMDGSKYYLVNPKDLTESIIKLIEDKKLRKQLGNEAYKFAKTLTPKSRAELMLKTFNKLIQDDAQPAARR